MPQLWRIRLTNIEYDQGKKLYADELFRMQGNNTLINLANGGGKTLLIQLLLQVVLPRETLNKRPISDLLGNRKYTGHILVEWKLDSEEPAFLTTGFCFTRGAEEEGNLKYFLYTVYYRNANSFDIKNLPLVEDKLPKTYSELLGFLKENRNTREAQLQVFNDSDKRRDYLRELRTYNLFEKEWKNIKTTNNVEGGVGEFFAAAKTTKQLLETILIPAVEEVIFTGEDEAKEMAQAFRQYHENLLRLPELHKNLQDFRILREGGEDVLQRVRDYASVQTHFLNQKSRLRQLSNRVLKELSQTQKDLRTVEDQLGETSRELVEMKYREESLPYEHLKRKLTHVEKEQEQARLGHEEGEALYQQREYDLRISRGKNLFLERAKYQADNQAILKTIELESQGKEAQLKDLDECRTTLSFLVEKRREKTQCENQACQEEIISLETQFKTLKGALDQVYEEKNSYTGSIYRLQSQLEAYQLQWDRLAQEYPHLGWLEDPTFALREIEKLIEGLKNNQQELLRKKQLFKDQSAKDTQELHELLLKIPRLEADINSVQKEKKDYEGATDELKETLARHSIFCRDPFAEKSRFEAELFRKKLELQEKHVRDGASLTQLKDQVNLIQEHEVYIPNREILRVQHLLQELHIPSQVGSEWLKALLQDETQREAYLRHNPLLPYALVLTEPDFKRLQSSKAWQSELLTSPVPLMIRNEALVPDQKYPSERLLTLQPNSSYMLWHPGYQYTISAQSLAQVLANLEAEIQSKEVDLSQLQDGIKKLNRTENLLDNFFVRYPENPEARFLEASEAATRRLHQAQQRLQQLEEALKSAEAELMQLDAEHEALREELREREKAWQAFGEWERVLPDRETKSKELGIIQIKLKECEQRIHSLRQTQEEIEKKRLSSERLKSELEGQLQHWQRTLDLIPSPQKTGITPLNLTYEEAEARWKAAEELHKQTSSTISHYEELLKRNQTDITRCEKVLRQELKLTWVEVPEAYSRISDDELRRIEGEVSALAKRVREAEKGLHALELEIKGYVGTLQERARQIIRQYDKEPYTFLGDLTEEERRINLKIQELHRQLKEWQALQAEYKRLEQIYSQASATLRAILKNVEVTKEEELLEEPLWQQIQGKLHLTLEEWSEELAKARKELDQKRQTVDQSFRNYAELLRNQENPVVERFVTHLLAEDERRFDLEVVETSFQKSFDLIAKYEEKVRHDLQESERNKKELVERCVKQAQRVAEGIKGIDRYVRVNYAGRQTHAIQIKLRDWDQSQAVILMEAYVDDAIRELKRLTDEQQPEEKRLTYIERKMSSKQLLHTLSNLDQSTVKVLKPEQHPESPRLETWEEVQKWSGGERYAGYMAMFMAILSFTRARMSELHNPPKVLIADNPFGVASSPHVLNLIFQLAESNQVQMICLTALTDENIFNYFPVVYSLRLRPFLGKDYMQSKIDKGFYQIDPLEEELAKKRQITFEW